VEFERNKFLADLTTFKIGGPADLFIELKNLVDIERFLDWLHHHDLPVLVIGGGSNLLVSDQGFRGLVTRVNFDFIEHIEESIINVGAGVMMSKLVQYTTSQGYQGLEWAGGLPGMLGGAIRGNAGCFNGEIKDTLIEVQAINFKTKEYKIFTRSECEFGYRESFFKHHSDWIIMSAKLALQPQSDISMLVATVNEKVLYRQARHPLEYPNAGSIFKNIPIERANSKLYELAMKKNVIKTDPFPIIPTAFAIDQCNLKGRMVGGARVSEKHPNFIINYNHASFNDVIELIKIVRESVNEKFQTELETEIQIIN
jgi:UDP-N-acetylmuramate dehydrogenase